jgi:hypothetical protein
VLAARRPCASNTKALARQESAQISRITIVLGHRAAHKGRLYPISRMLPSHRILDNAFGDALKAVGHL